MKTYKKEFIIANWSDIKKKLQFETTVFENCKWKGDIYYTAFLGNIQKDYNTLVNFLKAEGIDFINFDK